MSRLAAVVGTRSGWFVLRETPLPGPWSWFAAATFDAVMARIDGYQVVAVDVPLSSVELPEPAADSAARFPAQHCQDAAKVREVHTYMQTHPGAVHFLFEVHPQLSFLELEGSEPPDRHVGRRLRLRDRLSYLCDVYPGSTLHDALTAGPRSGASRVDILDAFAMLWSAKRIATNRAERLPSIAVYDARGFDMAIWY